MTEGPSVKVFCVDRRSEATFALRFFPPSEWDDAQAEAWAAAWFDKRDADAVKFTWSWGPVPRRLPKSRMVPEPVGTCDYP